MATSTTAPAGRKATVSYWATYKHFKSRQILWSQVGLHMIVPAVVAGWCYATGVEIRFVAQVLGGISILAGFLFTLIVFIFQLKAEVSRDAFLGLQVGLLRLVDELFATISHAIHVALGLVLWLLYLATTLRNEDDALPTWVSALLAFVTLHLLASLLTIAQRTRTAYSELP